MNGMAIALSFVLSALVAAALAEPKTTSYYTEPYFAPTAGFKSVPYKKPPIRYDYRYSVQDPQSGVVNDRWEERLGEYVKGQYSLLEPDGTVRTVDYEVDGKRGFHAVIRKSNPNLLSVQQLKKSRLIHQHPPVNRLIPALRAKASPQVTILPKYAEHPAPPPPPLPKYIHDYRPVNQVTSASLHKSYYVKAPQQVYQQYRDPYYVDYRDYDGY